MFQIILKHTYDIVYSTYVRYTLYGFWKFFNISSKAAKYYTVKMKLHVESLGIVAEDEVNVYTLTFFRKCYACLAYSKLL